MKVGAHFGRFLRMARIALTPRHRLLETTLSNGARVRGRNRAGHGGRGVYVYRDAIEPELEHLEILIDRSGVFIDVGANTGVYSLKVAKHFANSGVVVALEPFPEFFAVLEQNIRLNGFGNVRARCFCLAGETGQRTLWLNRGRPSFFSLTSRIGAAAGMPVQAVSLDQLMAQEDLTRLDYIKIDAEGAEREIVAGGSQAIEGYRPLIQAEDGAGILTADLPEYVAFRAPGSHNVLYLPREDERIAVVRRVGWESLDGGDLDATSLASNAPGTRCASGWRR